MRLHVGTTATGRHRASKIVCSFLGRGQRAFSLAALALAIVANGPATSPRHYTGPSSRSSDLEGRPIVIGTSYQLPSRILGGSRRINVRLPDHYGEAGRSFPVLFLLDGGEHEDFLHIAGLTQIIAAYGGAQEMIVIGIEGVDRRHDLTSPSTIASDLNAAPTSGGASEYRRFLVEELQPWVAGRFRTKGRRAVMGESLAGLFVLETLLIQPRAFDDYIAVSPSLWWNRGRLSGTAAAALRGGSFQGQRLWLAFDEPAPPAEQAAKERALQDELEQALQETRPRRLDFKVVRPGEGHASIYHPAALQALRTMYATGVGREP